MAATVIAGCDGTISLPGVNFKVVDWSFDLTIEILETTGLEDCTKTFVPTDVVMTGTWSGTAQYDAPNTIPIEAALATGDMDVAQGEGILTALTGCTLTGDVILTNINMVRARGAAMTHTGSFQFTGPVTIVWDEISG